MEDLTLKGTRQINGSLYGRVSHISGYRVEADEAANERLAAWRENFKAEHPELPDNYYSLRGTLCHSAFEHRLLEGSDPEDLHEWVAPFYPKARTILDQLNNLIWVERPIQGNIFPPGLDLTFECDNDETLDKGEPDIRYHVWSEHGHCGTPDVIARFRGQWVILDWKTSKIPYQTRLNYRGGKAFVNGYYKYLRTCLQLSAYLVAFEELTGKKDFIQGGVICVLPEQGSAQILQIPRSVLLREHWPKFREKIQVFNEKNKVTLGNPNALSL